MTTLSLSNVATITLTDGRTIVLDGSVAPSTARQAVKQTASIQRTPKQRKARKPLEGEALAKQVAFWSGKASKGQISRLKEAGSKSRPATLAKLTAIEARAELLRLKPDAKAAVIPAEVLAKLAS